MQSKETEIRCSMVRLEALEGDNTFIAQFSCTTGTLTGEFGLVGHEFIADGKVKVVIPLDADSDLSQIVELGTTSGLGTDLPAFLRSFAVSLVGILDDGKPLFDQFTFVVMDVNTASAYGIVEPSGLAPPRPYDDHVVLASKFSKAFDYRRINASNDGMSATNIEQPI